MIVVIIADLLYASIPLITFAWIFVGIIVGYPFGRLTKISWTSDNTQLALVGSGIVTPSGFHNNQDYYEHDYPHGIWIFALCIGYCIACLSWRYNRQDTWNDETNSTSACNYQPFFLLLISKLE